MLGSKTAYVTRKGPPRRGSLALRPLRLKYRSNPVRQSSRRPGLAEPSPVPRGLLSNRLLAHVAVQHYVYGVTLGQLENQLDVGCGTLLGALHQLARLLEPACEQLVQDYRRALVKHADETGWRTDGHNGYAWLFCTESISVFRFRQTRSGQVALQV